MNCSDHLANERTFLAWIRTSIGMMAFGFVIEKFSFFMRQFSWILGQPAPAASLTDSYHRSSFLGLCVVALGVLLTLLAFIQYRRVGKQINEGHYQYSIFLDIFLTLVVILVGLLLVIYLLHTI